MYSALIYWDGKRWSVSYNSFKHGLPPDALEAFDRQNLADNNRQVEILEHRWERHQAHLRWERERAALREVSA